MTRNTQNPADETSAGFFFLRIVLHIHYLLEWINCMARRVIKTAQGPYEIPPKEGSVHICMCGLSKRQPFCDKSCRAAKDEEEGKMYEYGDDGSRKEIQQ